MPGRCTVCNHPSRDAVERELVTGASIRGTAERFLIDRSSLNRHYKNHLSPAVVAVVTSERVGTVMLRAEQLVNQAEAILKTASRAGKASLALAAIREVRESLRLLGKLTGEIDDRPVSNTMVVNLTDSAEWATVKAAIGRALASYPDARVAVARELLLLGSGERPS